MTVFCFLFHMYFIYYFTRLRSAILLFINAVISLTINILPATQNGTCPYAHNYHQQLCWILIERTDCLWHTTWQCRNVVFNQHGRGSAALYNWFHFPVCIYVGADFSQSPDRGHLSSWFHLEITSHWWVSEDTQRNGSNYLRGILLQITDECCLLFEEFVQWL